MSDHNDNDVSIEQIRAALQEKTDEQRLKSLEDQRNELAGQIEALDEIAKKGQTVVGIGAERIKLLEANLEIEKELLKQGDARAKYNAQEIVDLERKLEIQRQGYNDAEGFAKKFMGITREPSSEFGKFIVGGGDRLTGLSAGLAETVDTMSIMTSTIDKIVEASVALAIEQDQVTTGFAKNTGQVGKFDKQIVDLERNFVTAGVSVAESGEAFQSLFDNVNDFTMMTQETQTELAETAAILNEFGISSDLTAKNIQLLTKTLGMAAPEAAELTRELLDFSQALGLSQQQVAEDLSNFGPMLAALGQEGPEAFRKLQVQVKATGLQINELLQITDQFNKFDTAAQSVGRLNALLGGPFLNTLELVNETNPAKRFDLLKRSIDKAGLSFDTMDFYQKKAIASAMGLNEQQLALMMRGRMDLVSEPERSAREIEELAQVTRDFQSLQEEMMQTFMSLAVSFTPAIKLLKQFLNVIQELAPQIQFITALYAGYKVAIMAFNLHTKIAAMLSFDFTVAEFGRTAATGSSIPVTNAATGAMTLFGFSMKAAFGIVGILIAGLFALAHVFLYDAGSPGLITILGMVSAALIVMGIASSLFGFSLGPVMPILLAFAAAIMAVGVGIGIASAGLSLMVNSLGSFTTGIAESMISTAMAVRSIVDSINEVKAGKAIIFTAAMAPVAAIAMSPVGAAAAVAGMVGGATGGGAGGGEGGASPTINITLSIDGDEVSTAVNSVEVSKYNKGRQSDMYNSIVAMIEQGLVKG
jgi:hypothetical protein